MVRPILKKQFDILGNMLIDSLSVTLIVLSYLHTKYVGGDFYTYKRLNKEDTMCWSVTWCVDLLPVFMLS